MSCYKSFFGLIIGLILWTSCGFKPIHEVSSKETSLLASIRLAPFNNRLAQLFHNALEEEIQSDSDSKTHAFLLHYELQANDGAIAIQQNQEITRFNLTVSLQYRLEPMGETSLMLAKNNGKRCRPISGQIQRQGGYDVVESDYAVFISRNDTEKRVVNELVRDLKYQLLNILHNIDERYYETYCR